MIDTKTLERYAELKAIVKEADKEIKELSPQIKESLIAEGVEEAETAFGKFYFSTKRLWIYSPETIKLEEELDKAKETEQQKGISTYTERADLMFKPKKDDDK